MVDSNDLGAASTCSAACAIRPRHVAVHCALARSLHAAAMRLATTDSDERAREERRRVNRDGLGRGGGDGDRGTPATEGCVIAPTWSLRQWDKRGRAERATQATLTAQVTAMETLQLRKLRAMHADDSNDATALSRAGAWRTRERASAAREIRECRRPTAREEVEASLQSERECKAAATRRVASDEHCKQRAAKARRTHASYSHPFHDSL